MVSRSHPESSAGADYQWRLGNLRFGRLGRAPQPIVGAVIAALLVTNVVMQFSDRGPDGTLTHVVMTVVSVICAVGALWWGLRGNWPTYRQSLVFVAAGQVALTLVAFSFSAWLASSMACITMSLLTWYIVMLHSLRVFALQATAAMAAATFCVVQMALSEEIVLSGAIGIGCMLLLAIVLVPVAQYGVWTGIVRASWQAERDPLTGLFNYRGMLRAAMPLFQDAGPREVPVVVSADLDKFKSINDTFGHAVGDEVLVAVARSLLDARPDAVIARVGGEEFAVVEQIPPDAVQSVAESVRAAIGRVELPGHGPISASVGECLIDPGRSGFSGRRLIKRALDDGLRSADFEMYEAKRAGDGRVHSTGIERTSPSKERCGARPNLRDVVGLVRRGWRHEVLVSARNRSVIDDYGMRPFVMTMSALLMLLWAFGEFQIQFGELGPRGPVSAVILNVITTVGALLVPIVWRWRSPVTMRTSLLCFTLADVAVVAALLTLSSATVQLAGCVSLLAVGAFVSFSHGLVPLLWHSAYSAFWICFFTARLIFEVPSGPLHIDAPSAVSVALFLLVSTVGVPLATDRMWTETSVSAEGANLDGLTGALNQRGLRNQVVEMIRRIQETDAASLIVCVVDIDGFKAVNDSRGHRAGNDLLRTVATCLTAAAGDAALVARLGGDEFAIVTAAEPSMAGAYARRLADAGSRPPVAVPISVSVGYTVCTDPLRLSRDHRELHVWLTASIELADRAMYRAKEISRARPTVESADGAPGEVRSHVVES